MEERKDLQAMIGRSFLPKMEDSFEVSIIREDIPLLKKLLLDSLVKIQNIKGSVSTEELSEKFEHERGKNFDKEDGFYHLTSNFNNKLNEGDLVRIKTINNIKTLWYPANLEDIVDAFHNLDRIFGKGVDMSKTSKEETFGNQFSLYTKKQKEKWSSYQFIDLGYGDGRTALLTSMFGLPVKGLEIDDTMSEIATNNIKLLNELKIPHAELDLKQGSFLDQKTLESILGGKDRKASLIYLYVTPMTWDVIQALEPFLKRDDYILVYRERLTNSQNFENNMKNTLKVELELPAYQGSNVNIYSVQK